MGTEKEGHELKTRFEAQYRPPTTEKGKLLCWISGQYYNPGTGRSSMGYNPEEGMPMLLQDPLPSFSTLKQPEMTLKVEKDIEGITMEVKKDKKRMRFQGRQ